MVNIISNELVEKTLNLIRDSEELGAGSCSAIDECYTDDELREVIVDELTLNPLATAKDVFDSLLEIERIRVERENEIDSFLSW